VFDNVAKGELLRFIFYKSISSIMLEYLFSLFARNALINEAIQLSCIEIGSATKVRHMKREIKVYWRDLMVYVNIRIGQHVAATIISSTLIPLFFHFSMTLSQGSIGAIKSSRLTIHRVGEVIGLLWTAYEGVSLCLCDITRWVHTSDAASWCFVTNG